MRETRHQRLVGNSEEPLEEEKRMDKERKTLLAIQELERKVLNENDVYS